MPTHTSPVKEETRETQEPRMKAGDVCTSVIIGVVVGSPSNLQHLCVKIRKCRMVPNVIIIINLFS